MPTRKTVFGEQYGNSGRQVHRKGGRFASSPVADVVICPDCRRINPKKVEPDYSSGIIDPRSMRPQAPEICNGCGRGLLNERAHGWQLNDFMAIG